MKNRPFIIKIPIVQHENLDHALLKSRSFNMKMSTVEHENLNHSS